LIDKNSKEKKKKKTYFIELSGHAVMFIFLNLTTPSGLKKMHDRLSGLHFKAGLIGISV